MVLLGCGSCRGIFLFPPDLGSDTMIKAVARMSCVRLLGVHGSKPN